MQTNSDEARIELPVVTHYSRAAGGFGYLAADAPELAVPAEAPLPPSVPSYFYLGGFLPDFGSYLAHVATNLGGDRRRLLTSRASRGRLTAIGMASDPFGYDYTYSLRIRKPGQDWVTIPETNTPTGDVAVLRVEAEEPNLHVAEAQQWAAAPTIGQGGTNWGGLSVY